MYSYLLVAKLSIHVFVFQQNNGICNALVGIENLDNCSTVPVYLLYGRIFICGLGHSNLISWITISEAQKILSGRNKNKNKP